MTEVVRVGFFGKGCTGAMLLLAALLEKNGIRNMILNRAESDELDAAFEGNERSSGVPLNYKSTLYVPGSMASGIGPVATANLCDDNGISAVLTFFGYEYSEVFDSLDMAVVTLTEDKDVLRRLEHTVLPETENGLFAVRDCVRLKAADPQVRRLEEELACTMKKRRTVHVPYSEKDRKAELLSIYNEHQADVRLSLPYRRMLDEIYAVICDAMRKKEEKTAW